MFKEFFFPKPSEHKFRKIVKSLAFFMLFFYTFGRCFYYPFGIIPSSSMEPSLRIGEFILMNNSAYGYSKYNIPWHLPLIKGRILSTNRPHIGDVIIFINPKNTKMCYIKRCVGLPGDRVQLRQGKLYINGQVCEYKPIENYDNHHCYEETMPNGFKHIVMRTEDSQDDLLAPDPRNNTEEFIVPDKHYFAMGDNRNNSGDSRYSSVGFIPEEFFIARGDCIVFSVDFKGDFKNPLTWYKFSIRFDRLGQKLVPSSSRAVAK